MATGERERFGGTAGRLLLEALEPASLGLGLALVVPPALLARFAQGTRLGVVVPLLAAALGSLLLARAAVTRSGGLPTWERTAQVAAGLAALSALWLVPMLLAGGSARASDAVASLASGRSAGAAHPFLAAALALTPPVFLVVSLTAPGLLDVFRPGHWRPLFSGRLGDLAILYAVSLGAVALVSTAGQPLVALAGRLHPTAAVLTALLVKGAAAGTGLGLLGRLAPAFVASRLAATPRASAAPRAVTAPPPAARPRPEAPVFIAAPSEPARQPAPLPAPLPAPPAASFSPAPASGATPELSRKPPLLDARERVEAERRRFQSDPAAALDALEELRGAYAVNAVVLQALCLLSLEAGLEDRAVSVAREAVPIALLKGNARGAAEVAEALLHRAAELALSREEMGRLTETLQERGRSRAAAALLQLELAGDPDDARAVKSLLQLAQAQLERESNPAEALRIFDWLLAHCPRSPLADFMRQGKAEAERRLSAA